MTVMTTTYILVANEGLALSQTAGTVIGLALGAGALGAFLYFLPRLAPETDNQQACQEDQQEDAD
jgi:hypothetical protein